MPTAKPFSWTVRFTVAPRWIQDGFALDDARALNMLAAEIDHGRFDELQATILHAPSPLEIARMQGYEKDTPGGGRVVLNLMAGTPNAKAIHSALIAARQLLDSVAFVATEGDTAPVIARLNAALAAIDTRQGERVEIEA